MGQLGKYPHYYQASLLEKGVVYCIVCSHTLVNLLPDLSGSNQGYQANESDREQH